MPEPPDFQQIAEEIYGVAIASTRLIGKRAHDPAIDEIVEQLRVLWNARGAADGAALKAELQRAIDLGPQPEATRPTINLEQMIKALDR